MHGMEPHSHRSALAHHRLEVAPCQFGRGPWVPGLIALGGDVLGRSPLLLQAPSASCLSNSWSLVAVKGLSLGRGWDLLSREAITAVPILGD